MNSQAARSVYSPNLFSYHIKLSLEETTSSCARSKNISYKYKLNLNQTDVWCKEDYVTKVSVKRKESAQLSI